MADAVTAGRKQARRATRKVERLCHDLWIIEGRLSIAGGEGTNPAAEAFSADLSRTLVDRMQPLVEALRKLGDGQLSESTEVGSESATKAVA